MTDINMIRDFLSEFLIMSGVYLFLLPLERMKQKKLRNAVILLADCVVLMLFETFTGVFATNLVFKFMIRFLIVCVSILICYQEICWEAIYCSVCPLLLFYSTSILWDGVCNFAVWLVRQGIWTESLYRLCFFAMVYTTLELTIIRWMPRHGNYNAGPKRTISAVLILFLSNYSFYFYCVNKSASNLATLVQIYCVTFLYMQAELFKKSEIDQELSMMERLWHQQKKQYEIAKDQMQVIDRKCHDLKYQVAAMRQIDNPAEREKNLVELEKSIRIYDAIVKTGNEILDTLLSEKSLVCEARDVDIHCVIDGKKLNFMDAVDIYALFGNAIDNAIECVEKFQEHEKRFIDVSVAEKQGFLYVRISNPIRENPEYEGDLPKTTKKNKQYHGIGLKSIRHIAEKYGGEIRVMTEMNCFVLEIFIPMKRSSY